MSNRKLTKNGFVEIKPKVSLQGPKDFERIEKIRKEELAKHHKTFYSLTEEQNLEKQRPIIKKQFLKQMHTTDTALKIMLSMEELLNQIGDLEGTNFYTHELKKYGNLFQDQLIKLNKKLLTDSGTESEKQALDFMNTTETLVDSLKKIHSNKYEEFIQVVNGYLELNNADVDSYIETLATYRFSKVQDYLGGNALIAKLVKHYPAIGVLNIYELSLILKKEELRALKGIGESSVNHLEKIFKYGGIAW
jgi:hypothetical protein